MSLTTKELTMVDEQQFLNMIYQHKGETIKVLTEM